MRKFGHSLAVMFVVALFASVGILTLLAMAADSPEPWPMNLGGGTTIAKMHHERVLDAEMQAQRAVELAADGIPEEGGRELLRKDPKTKGPKLFETRCAV